MKIFNEVLKSDRRLLVPILGTIGELPLGGTGLMEEVWDTLVYAVGVVEEGDLPTVVRVLLGGCGKGKGIVRGSVRVVRGIGGGVSGGVMKVVGEVVDRGVRLGKGVVKVWCEEIRGVDLGVLDFVVVLSGLERGGKDGRVCRECVERGVREGWFSEGLVEVWKKFGEVVEGFREGLCLFVRILVEELGKVRVVEVRRTLLEVLRSHEIVFPILQFVYDSFSQVSQRLVTDLLALTTPVQSSFTALLASRLLYTLSITSQAFTTISRPLLETSLHSPRHSLSLHYLTTVLANINMPLPHSFPIFIRKSLPNQSSPITHSAALSLFYALLRSRHHISFDLIPVAPLIYLPYFVVSKDPPVLLTGEMAKMIIDERIMRYTPKDVYVFDDDEIILDGGLIARLLGGDTVKYLDALGQVAVGFAGLATSDLRGRERVEQMLCLKSLVPEGCLGLYEGDETGIERLKDEELIVALRVFGVSVVGIGRVLGLAMGFVDLDEILDGGEAVSDVGELLRERLGELERMFCAAKRARKELEARGIGKEELREICEVFDDGWESIGVSVDVAFVGLMVWCGEDGISHAEDIDEFSTAIVARLARIILNNMEQDVIASRFQAPQTFEKTSGHHGLRVEDEKGSVGIDADLDRELVKQVESITVEKILATDKETPLIDFEKLLPKPKTNGKKRPRAMAKQKGAENYDPNDENISEVASKFASFLEDERVEQGACMFAAARVEHLVDAMINEKFIAILCSTAAVFVKHATNVRQKAAEGDLSSTALSFTNDAIGAMLRIIAAAFTHEAKTSSLSTFEEFCGAVDELTSWTLRDSSKSFHAAEEAGVAKLWDLFKWISTEVHEATLAALAIDVLLIIGNELDELHYSACQIAFDSLMTVYGGSSSSLAESYLPTKPNMSKRKKQYLEFYRIAALFDNMPAEFDALEAVAWAESLRKHCVSDSEMSEEMEPEPGEPLYALSPPAVFPSLLEHAAASTEQFSLPPLPPKESRKVYLLKPLTMRLRLCHILFSTHLSHYFISDRTAAISLRNVLKPVLMHITSLRNIYVSPSTDIASLLPEELSDVLCLAQELVVSASRLATRIKRGGETRAKRAVPRLVLACEKLRGAVELAREDMRIREKRWKDDGDIVEVGMGMKEWKKVADVVEGMVTEDNESGDAGEDTVDREEGDKDMEGEGTVFVDFGGLDYDDEEEEGGS